MTLALRLASATRSIVSPVRKRSVIADLATTEECDVLFRELNRRIRMGIPTMDVATYLAASGALTDLFADDHDLAALEGALRRLAPAT